MKTKIVINGLLALTLSTALFSCNKKETASQEKAENEAKVTQKDTLISPKKKNPKRKKWMRKRKKTSREKKMKRKRRMKRMKKKKMSN